MRLRIFLLMTLLFTGFQSGLKAQTMHITGHVVDTTGKVALPNVSVMAVRMRDSLLMKFVRTNTNGDFEFKSFPMDTFSLIIEHPAFESKSYFIFGNSENQEINIPLIRLAEKMKAIDEVVIYANKNPIYYRGDTLVYVADSFKVGQNAVVEDLLKKLPGISVDENGKITSQGKQISKVLVDGDEFFGSDPTIATKNLGAKGVQSVQIYEKKNEDAKEGEDDKIQVLDLKLKDDAKKGYFGKVSAASDFAVNSLNSDTKKAFYETELLFNKFNKKQKISVFLLGANTPKSNFGFGDMNKFGLENERNNSGMTMWNQNSTGNTSGIPQTLKTGVYYSDRIGKTGKLNFNYSYYDQRLDAYSSSQSQYFLTDSSYYTKDSIRNSSVNQSNRFNLTYSVTLDSLTYLEFKPNFQFDKSVTDNVSNNSYRDRAFQEYLKTTVENKNNSTGISSNSEALLRQKFKKPNRELELKYILEFSKNKTDGNLLSLTQFTAATDSIDQKKINNNSTATNFGILTYTEPIAKNLKAQVEYLYEHGKSKQDKQSFDRGDGSYTLAVDSLTNTFDNTRQQHRGTASLIYENSKHTISGGIGFRNIAISNHNLVTDSIIPQSLNNFLPKFFYQFKPSVSKRLNLTYSTTSTPAAINDLQPVKDNTNPNKVQIGNPDLKPNYVHSLRFNFNTWQALTGRFFWSGAVASLTNNAFATSTSYDQYGRTLAKTVNVNGNVFATVFAGGGLSVINKKLMIAPNINASYNRYTNYINNQENVTQNTSASGGFDFRVDLDSIEVKLSNNFSYTYPVSSLSSVSNQPYTTQKYTLSGNWTMPWAHLGIKWDATYTINSRRAAGFNRNIFVINTEVNKTFLKTQNLILALQANDILNQNLNLQRQVNGNVVTDNYTKIISRYFLLKLTYKFNNNKSREDEFKGWH